MDKPIVASRKPFYVELRKGRPYRWCRCGRSKKQPFCDNSHEGTGFEPIVYIGQYDGEEVLFCGCKQSGDAPFCDGTHANLEGGYLLDDPDSPENRAIAEVMDREGARAVLDGGCYVFSPEAADYRTEGTMRWCAVIGPDLGAVHQAQFYAEVEGGPSPIASLGAGDGLLFVKSGRGSVEISGREFEVGPCDGVYIRQGEGFRVRPAGGETSRLFISACPATRAPAFAADWPGAFDAQWPERVVKIDPDQRKAMGERWFQMLVDKTVGSTTAAQFIGHIPFSKAEPHRHLYEEAIIVLSGEGMMWTEAKKARVKAGDVIFLPRKQLHSLQCTASDGMEVVGLIHPGDNPGINY
jgi:mannose-6-phosphate isomerase-like protein (cupin superfamily)/CDGSH-type Zn-finger protein